MTTMPKKSDINYFVDEAENLGRSSNDNNNKIRENIITNMHNIIIDKSYCEDIEHGDKWINFIFNFKNAIKIICPEYKTFKIEHKAGRQHNYDYMITFYNETGQEIASKKLEFKFNASNISEAPQFVSPMKPSQYLSQSFEEYYYTNYLISLLQEFNLPIPDKELYLKKIHGSSPDCMTEAQGLYYQGCKGSSQYTGEQRANEFAKKSKAVSKECIKKFIDETDLNIETLSQYLINSQDGKIYLLYKNGNFKIQLSDDDYTIVSYTKNSKYSRYEAVTKTGKNIRILLRWKNGNGIAFPAFQIS